MIFFPINKVDLQLQYSNIPLKIVKNKCTYLGVCITRQHKHLFKHNFGMLLERIKKDLSKWSPLKISLIGRINSIKMVVLPKFLYFFQCLPLFIPLSFFKSLDSVISSFIWNGKHPRLRKLYLQRPRRDGGMSLPNFKFYYWAANIRNTLDWWHYHLLPNKPSWVDMELHAHKQISLPALLATKLQLISYTFVDCPVVKHSLRIWTQFRRSFGFKDPSLLSPVARNHFFLPSMQDGSFRSWSDKGITCFKDLFIDNLFASFEQLVSHFGLTKSDFFRVLQVRDYIRSFLSHFPVIPPENPLDSYLSCNILAKGSISIIYNLMINQASFSLDNIKRAWEEDLGGSLSDDTWNCVLKQVHSSSMCARHSLIQFKVVHRAHISKVKLAQMFPGTSSLCNRCQCAEGTLIHMFWTCPKLEHFWRSIFNTLSVVLQCRLEPEPLVAMFGVAPEELQLSASMCKILAFSSLLARRAILLKWKNPLPPTHIQWIRETMSCLYLEKIRYSLRGSGKQFFKMWQPFIDYVDNFK